MIGTATRRLGTAVEGVCCYAGSFVHVDIVVERCHRYKNYPIEEAQRNVDLERENAYCKVLEMTCELMQLAEWLVPVNIGAGVVGFGTSLAGEAFGRVDASLYLREFDAYNFGPSLARLSYMQ